jgi:dienelactone hydrolase
MSCWGPVIAADAPKPSEATQAAEEFAASFFAKEFDKAVGQFEKTMSAVMPAAKLGELLGGLEKQCGPLQHRTKSRLVETKQYQVVFVPCRFEKMTLEMKVVLDKELKVTGLFFQLPAANWKPPAYAVKGNFDETPVDVVTKSHVPGETELHEWRLPGFLTTPKGDGPFPGVVLVHGSGPHDADETIGDNKPFKDLAWGLAGRGVAVLRYVKRTNLFGKEILQTHPEFTVREETEDDAQSAVGQLRRATKIDPNRVYLVGHSLGGWIAPRIADNTPELAGIVIMAGNTRAFATVVVDQLRYIAELDGEISADEQAELDTAKKDLALALSPDLKPRDPVAVLGSKLPGAYFIDMRSYDPVAVAKKLPLPILVLQGESDYQVTMDDFAGWKAGVSQRENVRLKSFSNLNHLFMPVTGRSNPENTLQAGHVDEQVVEVIAEWIKTGGRAK